MSAKILFIISVPDALLQVNSREARIAVTRASLA